MVNATILTSNKTVILNTTDFTYIDSFNSSGTLTNLTDYRINYKLDLVDVILNFTVWENQTINTTRYLY